MNNKIIVSIVVPVYSGELYLNKLFDRINQLRILWKNEDAPIEVGELIFVDDNSIDNSLNIIKEISFNNSWVNYITMSKNFGQHASTIAGILHSSGNWIVTLDEDLQHPPENIENLLHKAITENLDIVYACSNNGPHGTVSRDLTSVLFKRIMLLLTGDKNIPLYNSFRLIRGEIARSASSVCAHDTYFDVSLSWFTNAVGKYNMNLSDTRNFDGKKSGYSFFKLFSHARKLLMSTRIRLYRLIILLGVTVFVFGLFYSGLIFINEFMHPGKYGSRGWPSLIITTMIFGSTTIILLSIILEYISLISLKAQGKPVFFVINRNIPIEISNYFKSKYGNC